MRILIVEDDKALCAAVRYNLEREGYDVDICNDGETALTWIEEPAYSLIILDRMLPGRSGLDLLSKIRRDRIAVHVLIVTALGEVEDRVAGLDAGADDYLTKPFAMSELLARVRSFERRVPELGNSGGYGESAGDIRLDKQRRLLRGPRGTQDLTKREAQLMEVFLENQGNVLSREMLFSRVWGPFAEVEYGNLDSYVHFLRRRLEETGSVCKIKTVRGLGYRMELKGGTSC